MCSPSMCRRKELMVAPPKPICAKTTTILPSQELLLSRNAVGCCKEEGKVHMCHWCKLPRWSPAL